MYTVTGLKLPLLNTATAANASKFFILATKILPETLSYPIFFYGKVKESMKYIVVKG